MDTTTVVITYCIFHKLRILNQFNYPINALEVLSENFEVQ
jgi:hypothetical protein